MTALEKAVTPELIKQWAEQSDCGFGGPLMGDSLIGIAAITKFAALMVAHQREQAAPTDHRSNLLYAAAVFDQMGEAGEIDAGYALIAAETLRAYSAHIRTSAIRGSSEQRPADHQDRDQPHDAGRGHF